jgi:hypothetical protein
MKADPVSKATTWLRVGYGTGAIADGLMVVAMLHLYNARRSPPRHPHLIVHLRYAKVRR